LVVKRSMPSSVVTRACILLFGAFKIPTIGQLHSLVQCSHKFTKAKTPKTTNTKTNHQQIMSKVHIYPNKQTRNISNIEQKVRSYIAAWNKDDLKLDVLFDDLYQHDFNGIHEGKRVNRRELKQMHTDLVSQGSQARLIYFRKAGACAYDMKIAFVNKDGGEFSVRKLITVEDYKIANSIDYNGTLASTKPNDKGYGLTYYWHLPVYLMMSREEIAGERKRTWHYVK